MFESFFPRPKLFLLSAILSAAVAIIVWYGFGTEIGRALALRWIQTRIIQSLVWAISSVRNFCGFIFIIFLYVPRLPCSGFAICRINGKSGRLLAAS